MSSRFGRISEVDLSNPGSWRNRIFVTFDIDWAADEVLGDTVDLVERSGVPATWFATHDTPVLKRILDNPSFEVGLHPNFNLLLAGDRANGADAEQVLDRLLAFVPQARSIRSHSLVQGGRLLQLFQSKGLTHDSNTFIPSQSGMEVRPWEDWFGMIRVPFFWEDDFWCATPEEAPFADLLSRDGLLGFNFHPIHVFLNTETLDRYEAAREHFRRPRDLLGLRYEGEGVRSRLCELLAQAA
jgi:hypothetical protein